MKNNNFIKIILYKIYQDTIFLSSQHKDRNLYLEDISFKLENWIIQLNNWNFSNKKLENIKNTLINDIFALQDQKNINVYDLWDIQNKIDLLLKVKNEK